MFSSVVIDHSETDPKPVREALFDIHVEHESDIILSRSMTGQVATLFASGTYGQSSLGAAVSEAVRTVFQEGASCRVIWSVESTTESQALAVQVGHDGPRPGHCREKTVTSATLERNPALELARRLVDRLDVEVEGNAVRVILRKDLVRRFSPEEITAVRERLRNRKPENLIEELQLQNQALIRALETLRHKHRDLARSLMSLEESNSFLKASNRDLKEHAIRDPLTGLLNRLRFDEVFLLRAALANEAGEPFSLIFFDVDDFKEVNDLGGHSVGDRALVTIADVVSMRLRREDSFFRWGGEEFLIVPAHCDIRGATRLAEELRETIERQFFEGFDLTCSFGVTAFHPEDEASTLVDRGDAAMYCAKRKGKNRVEVLE